MKRVLFLVCLVFPLFAERIYAQTISPQDREDVGFIVTILGTKPFPPFGYISDLKAAGKRVDPLHPLNFLEVIFTDPELAVCMKNIKAKHHVWEHHMMKGLRESLSQAAANDNLDSYLDRFAANVEIDVNKLSGAVHQRNWDAFVDILFQHTKRQDSYDRFDM